MQYRTLGRTGVHVSSLALGTMNFGPFGSTTEAETTALVRRALDAGVNLIDTADAYSDGISEELVGKALKGVDRDDVVLATKFRLPGGMLRQSGSDQRNGTTLNRQGGSRRWIVKAVEASLRRLGTDHIDLYQMHRPDPATDIEESLSALTDLQRAGKVLYIGTSTFSAAEIVEAQWTSERRALTRFVTEQPLYSILARGIEADVLPTARKYGMGVLTWSPLSGGFLSGKYRPGAEPERSHRDKLGAGRPVPVSGDDALKREAAEKLYVLAEEHGMSLVEMSLAFVTGHPAVTSALIGPRTLDQLESQLPAGDRVLTTEVLDRIDEVVAPGRSVNAGDAHAVNPALQAVNRRR
ncbi:aldo/keto reductase [Streptomyces sp. NPDC051576]|uniref:aldo/keto reductase n=1 Tax=Streptomyces sp. NPDC051576 TaxID=3155803 RepID=UPI003427B705